MTSLAKTITVQLIYAQKNAIWSEHITLTSPSTVGDAIHASSFFEKFPQYNIETIKIGIYGLECNLTNQLSDKDRIEIYRPLIFDPMESRRRRAKHKQRTNKRRQNNEL